MRSEIPQIEVVTAISEADTEDYVAQLLFSQGWSIIYRAFDAKMLASFLDGRAPEMRTVIVYTSEFEGLESSLVDKYQSATFTFISLDDVPVQAHQIMSRIRSQLRLPMMHEGVKKSDSRKTPVIERTKSKCVIVTGTVNAPGRTTIATALARSGSNIRFIDADLRGIPLSEYIREDEADFDISRPLFDEKYEVSSSPTVIDLGVLQPLSEVVNDRRWYARYTNELFENATHLVYVCKDNKQSLMQLSNFVRELPVLIQQLPITYICVTSTQGKDYRVTTDAFKKIIGSSNGFTVRHSALYPSNPLMGNNKSTTKKSPKEIGSIASSLFG